MDHIEKQPASVQRALKLVIARARRTNHNAEPLECMAGDVHCYAYRTPRGVAWGLNSPPDYINTARGVVL
jgi:hypothetical protein